MNSKVKVILTIAVITAVALGLSFFFNGGQAVVQTSSAAQIPEALILAFNGIAIGLFTAGFVYLFELTGIDFRELSVPIATSFAVWAVAEAQGWINSLPEATDPYLSLLFKILLLLIPGTGLLRLVSRQPRTLIEHS